MIFGHFTMFAWGVRVEENALKRDCGF